MSDSIVLTDELTDMPPNSPAIENYAHFKNTSDHVGKKYRNSVIFSRTANNSPCWNRFVDSFVLIWLDEEFNVKGNNYLKLVSQTRSIINDMETLNSVNECIDYIMQVKYEKVFLVISSLIGKTLWAFADDSPQIAAIYIFCTFKTFDENSRIEHRKLKGIYTEFDSLYDRLKYDVKMCEDNLIQPCLLTSSITNVSSPRNESQGLLTYYFSKLLINTVTNCAVDACAKLEMVTFCRQRYANNYAALYKIDEFEREYDHNYAIHWYTKCFCFYRTINYALRTEDIDVLYSFRLLIKDLHDRIFLVSGGSTNYSTSTVYRGQFMRMKEIQKMTENVGGFMTFNTFVSTSLNKEVALAFTGAASNEPDFQPVFFIIDIGSTFEFNSNPLAYIDENNHMDSEQEVLLPAGIIFRIVNVTSETASVFHITLCLVDDTEEKLQNLSIETQDYSNELHRWNQLGQLLLEMGENSKVEQFLMKLVKRASRDDDQVIHAYMLHQLGYIRYRDDDLDRALEFFERAMRVFQESNAEHYMRDVFATYYNMGIVYRQQKNYKRCIEYLEQARAIIMKLPQFAQQTVLSLQDLSFWDNRNNINSTKLKQITLNRIPIVDHTCLIVWLTSENQDSHTGHLLSEVKNFFSDMVILNNTNELAQLMLVFQFAVKPLYLIVSHLNDQEIKLFLTSYEKYLQALYVLGDETRRPVADEDVMRGVFDSRSPLIYRLATDLAERYQSFGDEEFDHGDTKDGEAHYRCAVDLYQKLAEYL